MLRILALLVPLLATFSSTANAQSACGKAYEAGQEARSVGELSKAKEQFKICSEATCPDFVVADCSKWLREVVELVPSVAVKVLDLSGLDLDEAMVAIDGNILTREQVGQAQDLNPGKHTVRVARSGYETVTKEFTLAPAEKRRLISIRLAPAEDRPQTAAPNQQLRPLPVGFFVASGVSAIGLGTFGALAVAGLGAENKLRNDDSCAADATCDTGNVKTFYLIADIGLGVGIVAAGVATYLFLTRSPATTKTTGQSTLKLDVSGSSSAIGAALSGRF